LQQRIEPVETRLRRQVRAACGVRAVTVHREQSHDVPQLPHRSATPGLDREQRLTGLLRIGVHHLAGRSGLDHHDAHVVRHHVVELAGDAGTFVLGRALKRPGLLAFQRGESRASFVGAALPTTQAVSRDRDRDQDQEWDRILGHGGHCRLANLGVHERRHRKAGQRRQSVRAVDGGGVCGDDAGIEGEPQRGVGVAHRDRCDEYDPEHHQRIPPPDDQRQHHREEHPDGRAGLVPLDGQERHRRRTLGDHERAVPIRLERDRPAVEIVVLAAGQGRGDAEPECQDHVEGLAAPRRGRERIGGAQEPPGPVSQPGGPRHLRHQAILTADRR
jgi:hypothetical protein